MKSDKRVFEVFESLLQKTQFQTLKLFEEELFQMRQNILGINKTQRQNPIHGHTKDESVCKIKNL